MKKIGVKPWAWAYVITKDGKKYYTEEKEKEISAMMESNKKFIRITIAGPKTKTVHIPINDIKTWGKE